MSLNELALFAGAGGGLLGSKLLGWRTVCAVENNPYRQAVLLARQEDGQLDPFPIWSDVRDFDGRPWREVVDIVTAGFPCQPFSVAGRQRGEDDERNMWPDTIRVIREVAPRLCLLENVPGLMASGYFSTVLGQLAEAGFDAEWCVLGANDVGAPHRRKRLWIAAHANCPTIMQPHGEPQEPRQQTSRRGYPKRLCQDVADAADPQYRLLGQRVCRKEADALRQPGWWSVEPDVGRVADGMAARVDRLAALGDGQVPAVVRAAWRLLNSD